MKKMVVGGWLLVLGALCLVVGAGVAQAAEITVTVPTVEWTTLAVKTNGTTVAGFAGGQLVVPSGTVVTVDYTATDDLTIDGNSQFTATVLSDMQLPTDAEKPVVTKQVSYMARSVDENGCVRFVKSYVKAIPLSGNTKTLGNGWYFVHRSFSCKGIDVLAKCTANLILSDGTSLTTTGPDHDAGIDVRDRETLNIYGQEQGTGALTAESLNAAGIGGGSWVSCGTVNIYGGKVTAKAGLFGAGIGGGKGGSGGKVNIYGGTVTATSTGEGAGIGGGKEGSGAAVTINGGTVTVRCYDFSGIGGGRYGSGGSVKINGGTVRVEGNYAFGENVSLGEYAYAYDITKGEPGEQITSALTLEYTAKILVVYVGPACNDGEIAKGNGGVWFVMPNAGVKEVTVAKLPSGSIVAVPPTVTKVSGVEDGQIRVYDGTEDITSLFTIAGGVITRQTVVVTVGELLHLTAAWTSGDGSETNAVADGFFVVPKGEKGVKVIFTPEKDYAIFGSPVVELGRVYDDTAFGPESGYLLPRVLASIPYLDWDAENRRMTNAVVMAADCEFITSGTQKLSSRKWNVVLDEVKVNNGHLAVPESESARLILADGASLTVTPIDSDDYRPGIDVRPGSTLSIYAQSANKDTMGRLSAVGTDRAAGIGGACIGSTNPGDCGTVNIYGGRVTATGGDYAAGIGGGGRSLLDGGAGGNVSICGGIVTAWGENGGAAIGGGNRADGGTVTIYGGEVIADNSKGESEGAGIGGGYDGAGGTITILGGKVTATGGKKGRGGAGIGGGDMGSGGTITISGGIVMATGGASGAGIGGGGDGAGCALTVSGGVTEAQNGIFTTSRTVGEDMEVTGEFNKAAYIKISDGNPTCEGGSIAPGEGGVWVVTPDIGVVTVTLGNLSAGATFVVPPSVTKVIGVDDKQILVYDGDTDVTSQYLIHGGIISPLKTFDDGSHYVESSGEAYVDTGYVPTVDTRIVADFNSMARSRSWGTFFGVTGGDSSEDGILLRYYDASNDLNGWFCNETYEEAQIANLSEKRLDVELKAGSLEISGTARPITTKGTPCDGSIYIFCGNNGGKAWRHQAMRLYSFRIYEGDALKRDFVPFQTTDGTAIAGLYDRVTKELFVNAGGGSLTLGEDDPVTCEGGSIAEVDGVWVVTPEENVEAVAISGLRWNATLVVPPSVKKVTGVYDRQIRVWDGETDVTAQYLIHGGVISPFNTFEDERHYVASAGGAYIDTGYVPTANTRIVADFNSMARSENWSVFFGMTSGDKAENGILLRYFEAEDAFNAWFCNLTNREVKTAAFARRRIAAELQSGSLTINGASYPITTKGTPCNEPIYIFCGNNGGKAWRPQAMRLYSFQIYEGDTLVRDFVPLRTTDGTEVAGLYDRVTEKPFANAGGGSLTLEADPICEGGSIAEGKIGVWTVTPDADVTAVKITDLPNGGVVAVPPTVTKVEGVPDEQIRVVDGGKDVTRSFAISDGFVVRQIWTVTVGKLEYLTAAWTSDDGVTNAIEGESFGVPLTATGVKVIFTPDEGYDLAGESVFEFRTLTRDIFFGPESGCLVPKAGICYLDWDEGRKQLTEALLKPADCIFMMSGTTELTGGGWYVVRGDIVIENGGNLKVSGSARLILCDGSSLTVRNVGQYKAAIDVTAIGLEANVLSIYGQENGSGTLTVTGGYHGAGIGGGASSDGQYGGDGGVITINGGTVTAKGGDRAAGIGGGYGTFGGGKGGTVTINGISPERSESPSGDGYQGCTVTATGTNGGAGIGGGDKMGAGGTVTINGGTVTATGVKGSAGIGGGNRGNGGTVTINGGTVTAKGGEDGAGIGGGKKTSDNEGSGGTVTITGGRVTAIGNGGGKGIGAGGGAGGATIKITGGTVEAEGWNGLDGAVIDGGSIESRSNGDHPQIATQPTNSQETPVYCVTVEGLGGLEGLVSLEGLEGYGTKDIYLLDGKLYLYLPGEKNYRFAVNGKWFDANVGNAETTATPSPLYKVTFNFEQHIASVTYRIDGGEAVTKDGTFAIDGLLSDTKISYSVECDEGYKYTGATELTIGTQDAVVNLTPTPLYKVSFNFGAHITRVTYQISGGEKVTTGGTFTIDGLLSGTKISCSVDCDEGYKYFGATELTVGTKNETVNLTAVRTADLTNVAYCGADGKIDAAETVLSIHPSMDRNIGDGKWYAIEGNVTVGTLTVNGTANLILADGTTLTVEDGIRVEGDNALNIYGQSEGSGALIANGADGCAGIGGGKGKDGTEFADATAGGKGGVVMIYGGVVEATGGNGGAGIGGGRGGVGVNEVYKNSPHASSSYNEGKGGGSCGVVTIYGGEVKAVGRAGGAGIGGGCGGNGANGYDEPMWVPDYVRSKRGGVGGNGGEGGVVTISGGVVTAISDDGCAGIGGGAGGKGGSGTEGSPDGADGRQGTEATWTLGAKVSVVEGRIGNDYPSVKIAEKVPVCTGGAIAKEDGKWVVTPDGNAAAVTITGLPAGESVEGIRIGDYVVPSEAFHGSTEDGTTYILLALKEDGVVTIDGEKIPVRVTIGEGVEAGEAFVVSGGRVTVKVKAIPGLKYALWRTGALAAPAAENGGGTVWGVVGESVVAEETTVTLTDGEPPEGQAFYWAVVSLPGEEGQSESGGSTDDKPTPTGMNNVVIQFSTVGPDKYADGTTVMDGECYALVWTPDGSEFQGVNPDGTAAGDSKVAVKAPIAIGGKCPNVQFQIDATYADLNYPNGTWGVYLLDTRVFATEEVTVEVDGKKVATGVGGAVSGYCQVVCNVGRSLSPAGAKAGVVQGIPAGIQPPTIRDFKVVNGMAYLYLKDTSSAVSYGVAAGQAPGSLAPVSQQPVLGGGNETIIITPATGSAQFYQGIVQ